jgi:hypothetical protein
MATDQLLESTGESVEFARQYLEQQARLIQLEAAERVAKTASSLFGLAVSIALATLVVLMLSIAAGFWLGNLWDSYALAFLAIGGAYLVIGLLVWIFREKLVMRPAQNFTLAAFFNQDEE